MAAISRILHPNDCQGDSAEAAEFAAYLARQFSAELHLLYVLETAMSELPHPELDFPAPGDSRAQMLDEPTAEMAEHMGLKWAGPLKIVMATLMGPASRQIVGYADEHGVDLIVMSTHGRTGVSHFLIGSVAEEVMRIANCPLVTVRSHASD